MDSSLQQLRSKAKILDGMIASHVIRVKRGLQRIQCVADVVRDGRLRLRWFGHLE